MRKENHALILETSNYIPYENILDIELFESANPKVPGKVRAKVSLQESDTKNQNGRVYDKNICQAIVETLKPKVKARCLFQEVDHPMVLSPDSDGMMAKKRAIIVELKNCGSMLSEIYMDGNQVIGIVETLSGLN